MVFDQLVLCQLCLLVKVSSYTSNVEEGVSHAGVCSLSPCPFLSEC